MELKDGFIQIPRIDAEDLVVSAILGYAAYAELARTPEEQRDPHLWEQAQAGYKALHSLLCLIDEAKEEALIANDSNPWLAWPQRLVGGDGIRPEDELLGTW